MRKQRGDRSVYFPSLLCLSSALFNKTLSILSISSFELFICVNCSTFCYLSVADETISVVLIIRTVD